MHVPLRHAATVLSIGWMHQMQPRGHRQQTPSHPHIKASIA